MTKHQPRNYVQADAVDAADRLFFSPHVYDGGRCIFCDVNDLDDSIYGPFECVERGPYVYTTETPPAGSAPADPPTPTPKNREAP